MIGQFLLLLVAQALFINGVYESMNDKMIFNFFKKWLEKKPVWIGKPLGLCVKCMASVYGSVTFWGVVLMMFGYHWQEIPVWIADIFSLVTVNFFIYKNV